nr:NACHT domain-containing protein [Kibdelosporangium sp. MJ126-NF4]CEL16984.1 putative large ATP-binding protein [Kibdelosporangium sp. MJ126-NF4]CTQ91787.1 putative large ATP-binding protein [Kibdelosporangium sp. MJ126-NF4]
MTDALRLAQSLVKPVVRAVIVDRRQRAQRSRPLSELVNVTVVDDYKRRKLTREIDAMCDAVGERLGLFCSGEWSGLEDAERQVVVKAVLDAFASADLSDDAFFEVDADPVRLARRLRTSLRGAESLSSAGQALYERLLSECCTIYTQIAVHLGSFTPRGVAESLARLSKLRGQVEQLLERLPVRSLDAPTGTAQDEEFLQRYLAYVSTALDHIELFGVHTRNFRPQTSLSVAYVSLTVSTHARRTRPDIDIPDENLPDVSTLRVEQALAAADRTLLVGEPGSGKTTLLQWLATTAARGGFKADLAHWNGVVPFFVRLRSYTGTQLPQPEQYLDSISCPFGSLMPPGWVHRVLSAGQALLLVDGVDELPVSERNAVREWIRNLLQTYPENRVVITARPGAAAPAWLQHEQFASASLERMSPQDIRELIAFWHAAIRGAGHLPCEDHELPGYERALLAKLETSTPLQTLATNPLLCTLLCALNLDQHTALPPDRMGIYAAALDMLLERRDVERRIPVHDNASLTIRKKTHLLQYLAWRLSLNNRTELTRDDAVKRVTERLMTLSLPTDQAESILDSLVQRSGVVRQPAADRIDFVHRTFQEYLTAAEAAEHGDVGLLIDRAHLDAWRETVILAAGHANKPVRHELLSGLLDRADAEPRNARTLRLLTAACLETSGPLDVDVRARIDECLASLVPPRRSSEVRSLASIGRPLLRHVPHDLSPMTEAQAKAMIKTVALIGDDEALEVLARFARTAPAGVQRRLVEMAMYFDPAQYADQVVTHLHDFIESPFINSKSELAACRQVDSLDHIDILQLSVDSLDTVVGLPPIRRLWVQGAFADLTPLTHQRDIEFLTLWARNQLTGLDVLAQLKSLKHLLIELNGLDDIEFVRQLTGLVELRLDGLGEVQDFGPLTMLDNLATLSLETPRSMPSPWEPLSRMPSLSHLKLFGRHAPHGGLPLLGQSLPRLRKLSFMNTWWLQDIEPLTLFESLTSLDLSHISIPTIEPLRALTDLETLSLSCRKVDDLSVLSALPNLTTLYIRDVIVRLDPVALSNRNATVYVPDQRTARRWRQVPGQAARIRVL